MVIYAREYGKKQRDKIKEFIRQVKNVPCADCHNRFPHYIMQFHHLDPATKEFDIYSGGGRHSIKKLKAEIEKCVIVCANCHLEREWGENGLSRKRWDELKTNTLQKRFLSS
jgi:formate-dependent nitrite reductase cytochrome c552 subunit